MTATEQPPERAEAPGLRRRVLVAVVLGLAVYAALALWADLDGLGEALRAIPWWAPLAACSLSLTNYLVRFPRWQRYLALTGSEVRGWSSLRIYLAGLSLTVSPGKVGEAMKSWLLRAEDGTPIARSAPIVLAERLTEEAAAGGVAAAFRALVEVHGEHPAITEQSMLTDSFERAMRPPADGDRRLVLPLGENIEIIPVVGSNDPPPPSVLDESFNPRR